MARWRVPGAALAGALALVACESGPRVLPPCPDVVVVDDTARLTQFRPGPGRDLTDVVMEASLDRFAGFCDTELDDGVATEVSVELELLFTAVRGPANTDRSGAFAYYVAIAHRDGDIRAKRVFDAALVFEGNRNRLQLIEELAQQIPLGPGERGDAYVIYVGFQLDREALDYNRRQALR